MSDGRKRLSGAKCRAEAKEKLAKQRKVVEQSVKIQSYFKKSSETSNDNILPPNPIENVLTDIIPASSVQNSSINVVPEIVTNVEPFENTISNSTYNTTKSISNDPGK